MVILAQHFNNWDFEEPEQQYAFSVNFQLAGIFFFVNNQNCCTYMFDYQNVLWK